MVGLCPGQDLLNTQLFLVVRHAEVLELVCSQDALDACCHVSEVPRCDCVLWWTVRLHVLCEEVPQLIL